MKKLLTFIFLLIFTANVQAAEFLKKTVKPSGGDYTSLEACMNANEQDFTGDGWFTVEIDGTWSSADTTAVTIHNYTTTDSDYINIYTTAAARHTGKAGTDHYVLAIATNSTVNLTIASNFVSVKGLEIFSAGPYVNGNIMVTGNNITIAYNILHSISYGSGGAGGITFPLESAVTNNKVYNNIIYNVTGQTNYGIVVRNYSSTVNSLIYNNTIYGCTIGINGDYARGVCLKNNICYNNTTDYSSNKSGYKWSTSTNNLAKDTTAPPYNTYYNSKTLAFTNTGAGTEDFHLVVGDTDAIDHATSSVDSLFTDDIDGVTRSGTWDIGADEYVGGAPPARRRMWLN